MPPPIGSGSGIALGGFVRGMAQLRNIRGQFAGLGTVEGSVGTVVEYAVYNEYGTSRMAARPFMSVGIARAAAKGHDIRAFERRGQVFWDVTMGENEPAEVVRDIAEHAAREVQAVIMEKGIYDTGNLHDSIAGGASPEEMRARSRDQAQDPSSFV